MFHVGEPILRSTNIGTKEIADLTGVEEVSNEEEKQKKKPAQEHLAVRQVVV